MNENLNLVEKLKDCPKGTKLYSPLSGECRFNGLDNTEYPINLIYSDSENFSLTKEGWYWNNANNSECMLWPSKEVRTWEGFNVKKPKFDPKTLKVFDRILARHKESNIWFPDFYSFHIDDRFATVGKGYYSVIIPYNEETKHLLGTTDEAPEYYRYWEN